jgi:hypothetical protein
MLVTSALTVVASISKAMPAPIRNQVSQRLASPEQRLDRVFIGPP